jgi:hypothetical protein
MMCFLHFKLECFNTCVTLVKYRRVCLHSENHTTKVIKFQSRHNSGAQDGGYRVIEFWWESVGTCAECLEMISECKVYMDIREIICGHWWLMVLGQEHVRWESLFSAALICQC